MAARRSPRRSRACPAQTAWRWIGAGDVRSVVDGGHPGSAPRTAARAGRRSPSPRGGGAPAAASRSTGAATSTSPTRPTRTWSRRPRLYFQRLPRGRRPTADARPCNGWTRKSDLFIGDSTHVVELPVGGGQVTLPFGTLYVIGMAVDQWGDTFVTQESAAHIVVEVPAGQARVTVPFAASSGPSVSPRSTSGDVVGRRRQRRRRSRPGPGAVSFELVAKSWRRRHRPSRTCVARAAGAVAAGAPVHRRIPRHRLHHHPASDHPCAEQVTGTWSPPPTIAWLTNGVHLARSPSPPRTSWAVGSSLAASVAVTVGAPGPTGPAGATGGATEPW